MVEQKICGNEVMTPLQKHIDEEVGKIVRELGIDKRLVRSTKLHNGNYWIEYHNDVHQIHLLKEFDQNGRETYHAPSDIIDYIRTNA